MPDDVRSTLIGISLTFLFVGSYYRIQSQRSGERLDRKQEGWPIMIFIRLGGAMTLGLTAAWLRHPAWFTWAALDTPAAVRWTGVAGLACSVAWLIWMFHTLGRNLTDTVVTRKDAQFVDRGPYRFVRNPMYSGVLTAGVSMGLALGTWLIPLLAAIVFTLLALRTTTEEKFLIERFGDRYRLYMQRVGRFFPKLPDRV